MARAKKAVKKKRAYAWTLTAEERAASYRKRWRDRRRKYGSTGRSAA